MQGQQVTRTRANTRLLYDQSPLILKKIKSDAPNGIWSITKVHSSLPYQHFLKIVPQSFNKGYEIWYYRYFSSKQTRFITKAFVSSASKMQHIGHINSNKLLQVLMNCVSRFRIFAKIVDLQGHISWNVIFFFSPSNLSFLEFWMFSAFSGLLLIN